MIDFGLHAEFMRPLNCLARRDHLVSLFGAMERLREEESAVYQVLFTPIPNRWGVEARRSIMRDDGKPFFADAPYLVKEAAEKTAQPLYAATLRLAARTESFERSWSIIRGMAASLRVFSREGGQSLAPLSNRDYDPLEHEIDLLKRWTRRPGMILNLDEVVSLAHWPGPDVRSAKLPRLLPDRSRPAPSPKQPPETPGTLFLGTNEHGGEQTPVIFSPAARLQHTHIIGATGTGKSSLMFSMIMQDLESGQGIAVLDPHGDLITRILSNMPESRIDDVVLFDPADETSITPFNVLSAHSDFERTLLASDLVGVFRDFSTSWGDRMTVIFRYLVLAFLEHKDGGTFAQMQTFLVDKAWRERFLQGVQDADVVRYWTDVFPNFDGAKSTGPILSRIDTLVSHKIINHMVNQRENKIDFAKVMDEGRILLVNLPIGLLGEDVSLMLGGFIMVKLNQMAMSRARLEAEDRRPFFCYLDECHHFVTTSIAHILTGARKYGLGLILGHQHLQQLRKKEDVAAAVMANTATRIAFRVADADARVLAGDFAHYEAADFTALPNLHAFCRMERADEDFNFFIEHRINLDRLEGQERLRAAVESSRARYTIPRKREEPATTGPEETAPSAVPVIEQPTPPDGSVSVDTEVPAPTTESADGEETASVPAADIGRTSGDLAAEVEAIESPASADEPPPPAPPPPLPGKGGAQHKQWQNRFKLEGERLGFRAFVESPVGNGHESVDVVLIREKHRIAIELSSTTSVDAELKNLRKCLQQDFTLIALLSDDPKHVARMAALAPTILEPGQFVIIRCDAPNAFLAHLAELSSEPDSDAATRVRGLKIRRTFSNASTVDHAQRLEAAIRQLAIEMHRPPPPDADSS
ncbi:MAG: type IV secretion system DNA-binding domain-containing protein [Verrucomicrobiales bacterium]